MKKNYNIFCENLNKYIKSNELRNKIFSLIDEFYGEHVNVFNDMLLIRDSDKCLSIVLKNIDSEYDNFNLFYKYICNNPKNNVEEDIFYELYKDDSYDIDYYKKERISDVDYKIVQKDITTSFDNDDNQLSKNYYFMEKKFIEDSLVVKECKTLSLKNSDDVIKRVEINSTIRNDEFNNSTFNVNYYLASNVSEKNIDDVKDKAYIDINESLFNKKVKEFDLGRVKFRKR